MSGYAQNMIHLSLLIGECNVCILIVYSYIVVFIRIQFVGIASIALSIPNGKRENMLLKIVDDMKAWLFSAHLYKMSLKKHVVLIFFKFTE